MIFRLLILAALASPVQAAAPPYYLDESQDKRSVGGINENDRSLYDYSRRTDLTSGGTVSGNLTVSGSGNGIT